MKIHPGFVGIDISKSTLDVFDPSKFVDATTRVRFLVAETESGFTLLVALALSGAVLAALVSGPKPGEPSAWMRPRCIRAMR